MANKRVTVADWERQAKVDPKRYARNAVRVAVDAGLIKKGDRCEEADETCSGGIEAHHESYEVERWLDVTWLCTSHHRRKHPFQEPPKKPTPGFEPGTARLRIGCSTTELSRRNSDPVSDPKPCPKRAQNSTSTEGLFLSVATSTLTTSHARELNRRPLHAGKWSFSGISQLFNNITPRISAFLGREAGKSHPESVPKPCLSMAGFQSPHTNPLLGHRFTSECQQGLIRAAREEEKRYAFRRHF